MNLAKCTSYKFGHPSMHRSDNGQLKVTFPDGTIIVTEPNHSHASLETNSFGQLVLVNPPIKGEISIANGNPCFITVRDLKGKVPTGGITADERFSAPAKYICLSKSSRLSVRKSNIKVGYIDAVGTFPDGEDSDPRDSITFILLEGETFPFSFDLLNADFGHSIESASCGIPLSLTLDMSISPCDFYEDGRPECKVTSTLSIVENTGCGVVVHPQPLPLATNSNSPQLQPLPPPPANYSTTSLQPPPTTSQQQLLPPIIIKERSPSYHPLAVHPPPPPPLMVQPQPVKQSVQQMPDTTVTTVPIPALMPTSFTAPIPDIACPECPPSCEKIHLDEVLRRQDLRRRFEYWNPAFSSNNCSREY